MVILYMTVYKHHSLYRQEVILWIGIHLYLNLFLCWQRHQKSSGSLRNACKNQIAVIVFSSGARILPVNLISTVMLYISHSTYDIPWIVCLPSCVMSPQSDNHSVQASTTTDQFLVFWAGSGFTREEQENMCYWQERKKNSLPIIQQ